ncbi:MAG: hypothetical protein DWQ08_00495 [Proteobacteria bacterium]|nr:MAG: hypothetical protein DWQ08_00495 [Pseudomonadota bacterium]
MKRSVRTLTLAVVAPLLLAACASDGPPVSNPSTGVSGRKHYGEEHEISLFNIFRKERGRPASASGPAVDDPEYQEYLEWKRWREFKEYQKWKEQNPGAVPPSGDVPVQGS